MSSSKNMNLDDDKKNKLPEHYGNDIKKQQEDEILQYSAKNIKDDSIPFYLDDNCINCTSFLADQSMECNELNNITIHSGHRMFDLHGFTKIGAEQALRRIFTSVDRSRQQVIKINVGQGSHSQDGIAKLPEVVKKVSRDLGLPDPVVHDKNHGFFLMILPPILLADG